MQNSCVRTSVRTMRPTFLFVHPSLFYVAVALQMTAILSEQEKPFTFHRDVVRAWSLDIAVDFSQRLLKFIESIRPTFLSR
jgi:hypothetical protein